MLYGCGLRVTEPLELRRKDVDIGGRRLVIRGAKGGKDRVVEVPRVLAGDLAAQMRLARAVWQADAAAGLPVALPGLLARKSPRLAFTEAWSWIFPAHKASKHPRTGEPVRWRMHEVNVQRAVRAAAAKAGLPGRVTPHMLRHCYATHAHEAGATARDLQEALGHNQLDTTMRYLTPSRARVRVRWMRRLQPPRDRVRAEAGLRRGVGGPKGPVYQHHSRALPGGARRPRRAGNLYSMRPENPHPNHAKYGATSSPPATCRRWCWASRPRRSRHRAARPSWRKRCLCRRR